MARLGGTHRIAGRTVHRMGYGAMQLAGPGAFGPPRDRDEAVAVLREAISLGIDHIDTSDYYGPYTVNRLIREALDPYPANLLLVTKLGARRNAAGEWLRWNAPDELEHGLRDNMWRLGIEAVEVANLRLMFGHVGPAEGDIRPLLEPLIACREKGILKHIGISNALPSQVAEARKMTEIACVQNAYNLANRGDDALIDELAAAGIPYVPFFPLGGFNPLQSAKLDRVAAELGATPMQVALAWLLQRSPNILLIPGTSSLAHLRENIAAAELELPADAVAELDKIGG
ncbi:oxidoreductase [Altererythrobacter salegens]|uniref:Oxidoreductase n=1 Tax=Croceibacterium salegens TaxID=1737568 RepID=A0A6I4SUL1_9SPHN|nr:oxidoreductase [Croceibacterium salegens]MXO59138.1 oxidoreductase [Croceibacterium salegens]